MNPANAVLAWCERRQSKVRTMLQAFQNGLKKQPQTPTRHGDDQKEMGPPTQRAADFLEEGFTIFSAVQANMVLLECQFDDQRRISLKHVDVLADIMQRGQWEAKDKLDFALCGGRYILVNGYHRMHAQVRCGKAVEWTVVIHKCRDYDEVRTLYYKFDTNTRMRSGAQILAAVGFAEKAGLSKGMASAVFRAIPLIVADFSTRRNEHILLTTKVTDRRLKFASEYIKAASQFERCLVGVPSNVRKKFLSVGTAAVALVTLRHHPVLAEEFWFGAAQNDGLRKGDARLALYNDLLTRNATGMKRVQAAVPAARAWNAYFQNKPIKQINVHDNSVVRIFGTPFEW